MPARSQMRLVPQSALRKLLLHTELDFPTAEQLMGMERPLDVIDFLQSTRHGERG